MFKVDIKSSTGVSYVGVVIYNVVGGCPVSLGVIKAAGVRGVSASGMASTGHYPPGTKNAQWRTNWDETQTKPFTAPRRCLSANDLFGLKASFL